MFDMIGFSKSDELMSLGLDVSGKWMKILLTEKLFLGWLALVIMMMLLSIGGL